MTDGERGQEHTPAGGDGEHAAEHVADSERGHDHQRQDDGDGHDHHDGDGHDHHDADGHHADDETGVGAAVVTVSSSRSLDDDPSGDAIAGALTAAGHEIATRELVRDEFDGVQASVSRLARRGDVDVVVTTGGTGVTPDDVTPEAIEPLLDKHLPGFGEEFRRRSVEAIGEMGMLSRATAGVTKGTVAVALPGSESAARTGVDLLTSVLEHLVALAGADDAADDDDGESSAGDDPESGDSDD